MNAPKVKAALPPGRTNQPENKNGARAAIQVSLFLLGIVSLGTRWTLAGQDGKKTTQTGVSSSSKSVNVYNRLPLSFEPNRGQTAPRVKFLSRGVGYTLFLTGDEAVLSLRRQKAEGRRQKQGKRSWSFVLGESQPTRDKGLATKAIVRMRLVGANQAAQVVGVEELPGKSNYFMGNEPGEWRTNVPHYAQVRYQDMYPGVDVVYYGSQGEVENDFVVRPGGEPSAVR